MVIAGKRAQHVQRPWGRTRPGVGGTARRPVWLEKSKTGEGRERKGVVRAGPYGLRGGLGL